MPEQVGSPAAGFAGLPYDQQPSTPSVDGPRYTAIQVDLLRRLLWAAKGARCSCLWSGGSNVPSKHDYECPRCRAIRETQEAVPDVI